MNGEYPIDAAPPGVADREVKASRRLAAQTGLAETPLAESIREIDVSDTDVLRVVYEAGGEQPFEAVGYALAGIASAYDPELGFDMPSRVVGELHIDGGVAEWEAEAGWLVTYVTGGWDGNRLVRTVVEFSEDLAIADE